MTPPAIVHPGEHSAHRLRARRMGVMTTQHQPSVFMREDCYVCRSEGLTARSEVLVAADGREIVANLFRTSTDLLAEDEIGMSDAAWALLGVQPGDPVIVRHPPPVASLSELRSRVYGNRLNVEAFRSIVTDIVAGRYNDVQLASFITACSAFPLDHNEIVSLTQAMVDAGAWRERRLGLVRRTGVRAAVQFAGIPAGLILFGAKGDETLRRMANPGLFRAIPGFGEDPGVIVGCSLSALS